MSVLDKVQRAFPDAKDCTGPSMKSAVKDWFRLYFDDTVTEEEDPCQRLPVAIVGRLGRACFSEYEASGQKDFAKAIISKLETVRRKAMQLALIGGESWLKPLPGPDGFSFAVMRRDAVAVLGRGADGEVTDLVSVEVTRQSGRWYTLLERRTQTPEGVRIENKLFSSHNAEDLGSPVGLSTLEKYANLQPLLPLFLSFAAGAMIYVVVEELIPETAQGRHSNLGTIGFALGFALMMILDVALG